MAPDSEAADEQEEELVLVDVKLEFMELIHLPGRCFEVVCVEAPEAGSRSSGDDGLANGVYVGDHGSFFAIPVRIRSWSDADAIDLMLMPSNNCESNRCRPSVSRPAPPALLPSPPRRRSHRSPSEPNGLYQTGPA